MKVITQSDAVSGKESSAKGKYNTCHGATHAVHKIKRRRTKHFLNGTVHKFLLKISCTKISAKLYELWEQQKI